MTRTFATRSEVVQDANADEYHEVARRAHDAALHGDDTGYFDAVGEAVALGFTAEEFVSDHFDGFTDDEADHLTELVAEDFDREKAA